MKRFLLLIVTVILCAAMIAGCKKDATITSSAHAITYKVVATDFTPFTDIIYTNETDSLVRVSNADSTTTFSKDVLTNVFPYYAKVAATGFNNSGADFNFTLQIFVDGAKVAEQVVAAPPHLVFDANATFNIQ